MLRIAKDLELPDDIVTETVAMLAKRGSGKSNAAVLLAEQMSDAGYQWVAVDPKGDWWGIRSSADGTKPGLSVPVFGGLHGDIPLEATAGALMAQLVIDRGLTVVLDVSQFSKAEQIRFVTDFAETLFNLVRKDPRAMHLFLEEAEEFLPQRVDARSARMVGAYSKISKQGRTFGLGVTLITQRSASLNKDALSQTDTLVAFRTSSPHDRKAIGGWLEHHDAAKDVAASLAELEPGESWIISPGFLGTIVRIQWLRRRTFDSGATPRAGARRRTEPASLADIDLDEVAALMADTIERAQAHDPATLQKKIRDLERRLNDRPEPERVVERVEIPVVDQGLVDHVNQAIADLRGNARNTVDMADRLATHLEQVTASRPEPGPVQAAKAPVASRPPKSPPSPTRPVTATVAGTANDWPDDIGKAGKRILTVLAQHGAVSKRRLALQAGYSANGGGFGNALSRLRTLDLIATGDPIALTAHGAAAIPVTVEVLPDGDELIEHWIGQLGRAAGLILRALTETWPDGLDKEQLAATTGYEPGGGGFGNALSRLRTLDLINGNRGEPLFATDDLMFGAGR